MWDQGTREHISNARKLINRKTHYWKVALSPNYSCSYVEEVFKLDHRDDCVEQEAKEVRKSTMRHAIDGPWTMVIHLWDASATKIRPLCTFILDSHLLPSADLAVVCPWRLERLALPAPPVLLWQNFRFVGRIESEAPSFRYGARICEACSSIGDPYADYETVKVSCLAWLKRVWLQILK